jgi:hypothetical protein
MILGIFRQLRRAIAVLQAETARLSELGADKVQTTSGAG